MTPIRTTLAAAALTVAAGALLVSNGAAQAAPKEQSALSKDCSTKADAQNLHGKERKAFRSKCKREGAAAGKKS